jgi:uncharacterized protein YndB with AHSA1/START domain
MESKKEQTIGQMLERRAAAMRLAGGDHFEISGTQEHSDHTTIQVRSTVHGQLVVQAWVDETKGVPDARDLALLNGLVRAAVPTFLAMAQEVQRQGVEEIEVDHTLATTVMLEPFVAAALLAYVDATDQVRQESSEMAPEKTRLMMRLALRLGHHFGTLSAIAAKGQPVEGYSVAVQNGAMVTTGEKAPTPQDHVRHLQTVQALGAVARGRRGVPS